MHKFEKINQIDNLALNDFLQFVKYPKFYLFPKFNIIKIKQILFKINIIAYDICIIKKN